MCPAKNGHSHFIGFAGVSRHGNSSIPTGKRQFPYGEIAVSCLGTGVLTIGNERFDDRKINVDAWRILFLLTPCCR